VLQCNLLKIYLELLGCVVFKTFASFGFCDHVHSFIAIVHLACLLANHEWKDTSEVQKSQILYLLSIPWFIFVKILILGISSNQVRTRLIWKDSIISVTTKVEILQVQKSLKWKDFIIINSSQVKNGIEFTLEIPNSIFRLSLCQGINSFYL
jgi:hypothetical protein